jgi:hypothetical protein
MVFDFGPMLAMNPGEMETTQQLNDLGQNRRPDNITGGLGSSQTHGLYIGDLAVTARTARMQTGRQEK